MAGRILVQVVLSEGGCGCWGEWNESRRKDEIFRQGGAAAWL